MGKNNKTRLEGLERRQKPRNVVILFEDEEEKGLGRLFLDENYTQEVDQAYLEQLDAKKATVIILSYTPMTF